MTTARERFARNYLDGQAARLKACESRLDQVCTAPGGSLGESCSLTLKAGGKRLRPLLVFLTAKEDRRTPVPDETLQSAAVAVELVHMATLVHDDVLDDAALRRGQPTLLATYGSGVSAAAGDYLFSAAFDVLSDAGSGEAIKLLAGASLELSQGELLQMRQAGDFELGQAQYEARCALKTGSLFAVACCLGAQLTGCSLKTLSALGDYGRFLGLAFQIADDILDFTGDASQTGKLIGTDLRDGTVNLPLIMALKQNPPLGEICAQILKTPGDQLIQSACRQVAESGALEAAALAAAGCAQEAQKALARIDELDTEPLSLIARIAADRKV